MGIFAKGCRVSGCPCVTTDPSGLCESHRQERAQERKLQATKAALAGYVVMPDGRRLTFKAFYDSPEWQKIRAYVLHRDGYRCVDCGDKASPVDHVKPIAMGGAPLDAGNLRSKCWSCHSRKTATCDGGFGNRRAAR